MPSVQRVNFGVLKWWACAAFLLLSPLGAGAVLIGLVPAPKAVYLQVGVGRMTGGSYSAGGTPGNNPIVNKVSVVVPASQLGAGPQVMTTDSTQVNSTYDNYPTCPVTLPATSVYFGGVQRSPGNSGGAATLTVVTPLNLVSGSDVVPFSTISWRSVIGGDGSPAIRNGVFVGGTTQTLLSLATNTWFESCLRFTYDNAAIPVSGTYRGAVTYTLTVP
jgi:hypothetical protein